MLRMVVRLKHARHGGEEFFLRSNLESGVIDQVLLMQTARFWEASIQSHCIRTSEAAFSNH